MTLGAIPVIDAERDEPCVQRDGGTPQPKEKYLASSTDGAPPAPPSLVKAVRDGDVPKARKVLKKLTVGKGKGKGKGKGRKKKCNKGGRRSTTTSPW